MAKKNAMLAKRDATIEAKYNALFHLRMDMLMQMGEDAGMMAAHEVLGMGPGRAPEYAASYREHLNEMARIVCEDQKDDEQFWYAKHWRDERIKRIVGEENFAPWEECYVTK